MEPGINERVRWGRPARLDRTGGGLLGRGREARRIDGLLGGDGGPCLVLVHGERGVGRSAFLRAAGERLRARGAAVHAVDCVPGDAGQPLLLALRLVLALEGPHASGRTARALSAVDRRDPAAMEALLHDALARRAPVAVLVDDAEHADADSLAVLGRIEAPGVRLVVSAVRGNAPEPAPEDAREVVLLPLGPPDTAALIARWLRAAPDIDLARRVGESTRGVPGAVEALLAGWTDRGDIRIADGHAFLSARATLPVLPDDDRFVTALDRLGEHARAVAAALSVLAPLGEPALELTAAWTGLSPEAVGDGVRRLVEAGVVEEAGWAFTLALTAHTVRERLSPVQRSRLSAMAVGVLWAETDAATPGVAEEAGAPEKASAPKKASAPEEAGVLAYRADRIADAGNLVDRARAVAELTAVAERVRPGTDDRAVLRWLRATVVLTEGPARDSALRRIAGAAYLAGDYRAGRDIAESMLRNPGGTLTALELQHAACLLVSVTAGERDLRALSAMATARWWDELPVPVLAKVSGQALALGHLTRWQEVRELLARTEAVWDTGPQARATPRCSRATADLMLGRPESFQRELALPDAPELAPDTLYALVVALFDLLAADGDLRAGRALLDARGLSAEVLPPLSRFLHHHLTGRWDQALEGARRLLANGDVLTPATDGLLLPARTAGILLARGRVTTARHVLESMRGPVSCSLHAAEAEVAMTLGDLTGAEETLRRGLEAAQAHALVFGTDELWALLAEVTAESGRTAEARVCLERLERISARSGSGRARLRYLLASARVLRDDDPDAARAGLVEAVELARSRALPFETATTLVTAAAAGACPVTVLHEAYDLFGDTGAGLWRHHTRTALRAAGLTVPGRARATAENDRLLATLLAEQLTNRQIAAVLRISEAAAANRLTRLFTRTGTRSRTQLVAAVLAGSV